MKKEYNSMSFDFNSENERKSFNDLLSVLIDYNNTSDGMYNDIHIYQEDCLVILEWDQVPLSGEWGGTFKYVDCDEVVMRSVTLPDNSIEYAQNDAEEK